MDSEKTAPNFAVDLNSNLNSLIRTDESLRNKKKIIISEFEKSINNSEKIRDRQVSSENQVVSKKWTFE